MGMEQTVTFPGGKIPPWTAVSHLLNRSGFPVQVRMIDGELAFPDETPPETWKEMRLGTPQGMVTLRRSRDHIVFVTWGNADPAMLQAWNALTWAFAEVADGRVIGPDGPKTAADLQRTADLPPILRKPPAAPDETK